VIALSFALDYFLANVAKEEKPNVVAIVDDDKQVRDSLHDPDGVGWLPELGVRIGGGIPELRRTRAYCVSDHGHPYAGNVRFGTPNKAKAGALQNSHNLHYCAR
jgi:hypothetical protein